MDYGLVRQLLNSPRQRGFIPIQHDAVIYLIAQSGAEVFALFMGIPSSSVELEIHIHVLPAGFGEIGRRAGRLALDWVWLHTAARKCISFIAECRPLAIRWARDMGFTEFARDEGGFLDKAGNQHDRLVMQLFRPRVNHA